MITENGKAIQIKLQLLPSPCHVSFINQEHGSNNSDCPSCHKTMKYVEWQKNFCQHSNHKEAAKPSQVLPWS